MKKAQREVPKEMDPVEVFCRVRPVNPPGSQVCARVSDGTSVQLTPPESAVQRNPNAKTTQSQFTGVMGSDVDQTEVFERVCSGLVADLVSGKNGLLFAYGITGSGKTHTMTGNPEEPGILPRTLDVLFNSIQDFLASKCVFSPDGYNLFNLRTEGAASLARQDASRRNKGAATPRPNGRKKGDGSLDWEMVPRETEIGRVRDVDEDNGYAVFVSYTEVYNNYVYDLLDPNLNRDGKMAAKGLRDDRTRTTYVNDLTEVEVTSTEEAFQQFIKGQQNRRVAQTSLNAESSRSHSVFNIRLVQAPLDPAGRELLQDKTKIHVSQLSLVDLAGSERSNRTGNTGERMAESGHINGSLMTLRRCIEQLRENQQTGAAKVVPYRESRLTHLFKNFFDGEGKVRMIVCLNPSSGDYEENLHVMQFAEMTQEVEVQRASELDYAALFPGLAHGRRRAAKYQAAVDAELEADLGRLRQPGPAALFDALPRLRIADAEDPATLRNLRELFLRRSHQREDHGIAATNSLEDSRLPAYVKHAEATRRALEELETETAEATAAHERVAANERLLRRQNQDLRSRIAKYEADASLRHNNERSARKKEQEMAATLKAQENRFAELRDALGTASVPASPVRTGDRSASLHRVRREASKENHGVKSSTLGHPVPRPPKTPRSRLGTASASSRQPTTTSGLYPRLPAAPSSSTTDSTSDSRARSRTRAAPAPPPRGIRKEAGSTPTLDPRSRRRSKSLTIDHQPASKVPGASMEPGFGGMRTKRTTRPRSGDLAGATDYALTHQELDEAGNVRTQMFKGDVHGTVGGGSAVVFKDVEELTHRDPAGLKRSSFEDEREDRKKGRRF